MRFKRGPRAILLVRHGQSQGNVAREVAYREDREVINLATRDADVTLSDVGEQQSWAVGRWLGEQPDYVQPTAVIASPYVRTQQTASLLLGAAGGQMSELEIDTDERLREREEGILDQLTWRGTKTRYPGEAIRARKVGRYYYRPPGGESWTDLLLRLRDLLSDTAREYRDERLLLVSHDVPLQLICAILNGLSEEQTIDLIMNYRYANCGLTRYELGSDGYKEMFYNYAVPVAEYEAPVTEEKDVQGGPR